MTVAKKYTAHGKTMTLREWEVETGVGQRQLYNRMELGHTLEHAIAMGAPRPKASGRELHAAFGEEKTLDQWAMAYNLSRGVLLARLQRHTLEDALVFIDKRGRKCASPESELTRIISKAEAASETRRGAYAIRVLTALAERGDKTCIAILGKVDRAVDPTHD